VHLGRILLRKSDFTRARDAYLDALAVNPFDPEVHLALYRCYDALNDAPLRERVKKAFMVLAPKVQEREIANLAKQFARDDDLSRDDMVPVKGAPGDGG
jgi:hypothetical protein